MSADTHADSSNDPRESPGGPPERMWRISLPYLWRALRRSPGSLAILLIGSLIAGTIATIKSLIESQIINAVADAVNTDSPETVWLEPLGSASTDDLITNALFQVIAFAPFYAAIIIYLFVAVLAAATALLTTNAREKISILLLSDLFRSGVSRSFEEGSDTKTAEREPGGMAGALQQGSFAVSSAYALLVEAGQYLVGLATVVFILWQADFRVALICLIVTLLLALLSWRQGHHLASRRERFDEERRSLFGRTNDVLANRDVLIAHERKIEYVNRLAASSVQLGGIDRALAVRESFYRGSVNLIQDVGQISILVLVLAAASAGLDVQAVGDAYFYVSLFARIMGPVRALLSGYDSVLRSMSTSKTLVSLLAEPEQSVQRELKQPAPNRSAAADFDDVTFAYGDDEPVLSGCTFKVPEGGVTLVVGRSGTGKTTISRLLLGFIQPSSGAIRVLGQSVANWDREALMTKMSYLAQTGHIVDGDIRENLFAAEDVTEEQLTSALMSVRLARSHQDALAILRRPARGLSEGQKQRLALARILVDTAPVVILDEPLAGVDGFTFAEVRDPLAEWMAHPDRTVILVTHRLSFASVATHVVVLGEGGSVLEEGTPHDLLLQRTGHFQSLVSVARKETENLDDRPLRPA